MARALRSSLTVAALVAVVLAGNACQLSRGPATVRYAETTASVEPSAAATQSAAPDPAVEPAPPIVTQPLNESQAQALEAELEAIERELDALDLPTDSDFEGIESALP